jgi:glycosyltransferase involved in cell wall biosynthesis
MRVAFIAHSYHRKTQSHRFIVDLLSSQFKIDLFYDESWSNTAPQWVRDFNEDAYDIIIIHQMHQAFTHLTGNHPNVVFIPMYDAMLLGPDFYWQPAFNQAKILCFSWELRKEVMAHNSNTALFQYFPDPSRYATVADHQGLRGFFWYRVKDIDLPLIANMCQNHQFDRFLIHNAPDPGNKFTALRKWPPQLGALQVSTWLQSPNDYIAALRRCNIFFAPRPREGIGMSFLEAMASGMCVVAPNAATMNEYISNGTNGLLYQLGRNCRLEFTRARDMGLRARESVERGFRRWQSSIPMLLEFIAAPTAAVRSSRTSLASTSTARPSPAKAEVRAQSPRLTIITVCLNSGDTLEDTIRSVIAQDAQDIEYVILDGGSTDGTVDIIKRYSPYIAYWQSVPDAGVYFAMNAALEYARGDFVLFLNSDDTLASNDAISRMLAKIPDDADVVYGHHIYRRADGLEELHRAADFETTWTRLKRGDLWYDWLAGIPAHQATAIRRTLIGDLRFDTRYKIAADHDLLFRCRGSGKQFFNCDELVAIYVGGGFSAKNYDRCKQEWATIARTYGDPVAADRFYALLDAPADGHNRAYERLRRTGRGMIFALHRRSPVLGSLAQGILRRPAILWFARRMIGLIQVTGILEAVHRRVPHLFIDFSQVALPQFVVEATGLSLPKPGGRWIEGPCLSIRFRLPLPRSFTLELNGYAVDVGAGSCPVTVVVGGASRLLGVNAGPARTHRVTIDNHSRSSSITIYIPDTNVLAQGSQSRHKHPCGIALVSLRVADNTEPGAVRMLSRLFHAGNT